MKTDGYVKLDGDQLSADLAPNFELLKFFLMWEDAHKDNKIFDINREIAKKEEKAFLLRMYLENGDAKLHFDLAKAFSTEVKVISSTFFGIQFFKQNVSTVSEDKLIKYLKIYNPDFWNEKTCHLFMKKFELNFGTFSNEYSKCLVQEEDRRVHRMRGDWAKSNNDYLYEQIAPFTKLSGEVFVCIDDYNLIKRFIKDIKSALGWL